MFDLNIAELDKTLQIKYWLPKMHKTPIEARFVLASKNSSTKPLSDTTSKILVNQRKILFQLPLNFKINIKKNAKSISTFDFGTLFTTTLHKLLFNVLSVVNNFQI